MGDINFKSPAIALDYIHKLCKNNKVIVESYSIIYIIDKGMNKVFKYEDFKNFNDLVLNSINNLANDIDIDVSEFNIMLDNYQTLINFPISKIEIQNIQKLNTLKKEFNRQYNGAVAMVINLKYGDIKLNISNSFRDKKMEFDKLLNNIENNFEMDIKIQDKDISLIPRFEWFRKID